MDSLDSRIIANRILDIADDNEIKLTIMQLLKLVYIAHGWWLTFTGKPLTSDNPEAWRYGPVYPAIYSAFRSTGIRIVDFRAKDPKTDIEYREPIPTEIDKLLKQVVQSYGKYHAFELSRITHEPGTPWDETVKESGYDNEIHADMIKEHFDDLRKQRSA